MGGCPAPNCSNSCRNGFRVFIFPRNPERRTKWLQMCRRDKWQPTLYSTLREAHFEESQFESARKDGWKTLKPNAVTTIFNVPNRPKPIPPKRRPIIPLPADEEVPPEVSYLAEVEEPSIALLLVLHTEELQVQSTQSSEISDRGDMLMSKIAKLRHRLWLKEKALQATRVELCQDHQSCWAYVMWLRKCVICREQLETLISFS